MTKRTINIGIIGVGIVAERIIKAINKIERAKILGIYDINRERLEYISNEYNLSLVNNYEELLNNKDIDLIYLAVPPKYHHSIAIDIIKSKKHIICEKPLANSIDEAKEMYEKAEESNIIHAMNFPLVYTPSVKKLRSLLNEGYIGDLRRIELSTYFKEWPRPWQQTNWISTREQGGFVREVFTHYIQLTQMLFGNIVDINSIIQYPEDPLICETGIIANGSLSDNTPILLNGFSNIGMEENLSFTIFGTEGVISLENWRDVYISSKEDKRQKLDIEEYDHLVELINEVFKAIDGKDLHIITFKEGYYAQIIIEKLSFCTISC